MGSDIRELWIMQEHGPVMFQHTKDENVDSQIFGGFISAITSLAKNFTTSGLQSFELGDHRFFLFKQDGLLFIANTEKRVKIQKIEKEIKTNATKFMKKYSPTILHNWDGNTEIFEEFHQEI
jgi:hypothetical protein